jgi:hypothetical protein
MGLFLMSYLHCRLYLCLLVSTPVRICALSVRISIVHRSSSRPFYCLDVSSLYFCLSGILSYGFLLSVFPYCSVCPFLCIYLCVPAFISFYHYVHIVEVFLPCSISDLSVIMPFCLSAPSSCLFFSLFFLFARLHINIYVCVPVYNMSAFHFTCLLFILLLVRLSSCPVACLSAGLPVRWTACPLACMSP